MKSAKKTIFYSIERTIKKYRQYAVNKINEEVPYITLDQSLMLKELMDIPNISQTELGAFLFKDLASISRMVESLVKKELIKRTPNEQNRRQNKLVVNKKGTKVLNQITEIIKKNRKDALKGITRQELDACRQTLDKIFNNLN